MVGFVDAGTVERMILNAIKNGDRDPSVYVNAELWLKKTLVEPTFDPVTVAVALRDPRIRAIVIEIGQKAIDLGAQRRGYALPSKTASDTLGWRIRACNPERECLISPMKKTEWLDSELRAEEWCDLLVENLVHQVE